MTAFAPSAFADSGGSSGWAKHASWIGAVSISPTGTAVSNAGGQTLPGNNGAGSTSVSDTSGTSACQQPSTNTGSGGANQTPGPFDATCVGQVQGGHPAGSVGKADNKNPNGQSLGDKNNGYECDNNPGIGNGNPAHTACAQGTNPPPPHLCPNGQPVPASGVCPGGQQQQQQLCPNGQPIPPSGVCGSSQTTTVQATSTQTCASGQTMVNGTCQGTSVLGETLIKPTSSTNLPAPATSVAGVALKAAPAGVAALATTRTLPFTGSNTGELAGLSLVLLLTGTLLVLVSRRRPSVSDELAFSGAGSHGAGSGTPSLVSAAVSAVRSFGPAPSERPPGHQRR